MAKTNTKRRKLLDQHCIEYIDNVKKQLKQLGIKNPTSSDALNFIINQNAGFNSLVMISKTPKTKKKEFRFTL